MYDVCLEYTTILAGTDNQYSKAYLEVTKNMEISKDKNLKYVENFMKSIEEINKKCGSDTRISSSKGNIKDFKGYKDITTVVDYFKTSGSSVEGFKDLVTIKEALERNQSLYTEAYSKGIRVLILEYETALYMLVTGLSLLMATNVDVSNDKILIQKKTGASGGVILKTCKQFAKELDGKKHREYMDGLIKVNDSSKENKPVDTSNDDKKDKKEEKETNVNESVFYEDMAGISVLVASTLSLVDNFIYHLSTIPASIRGIARSLKKTFFGIIPLIRCGIYIKYKKKADTIVALEQQAEFLQKNIDRLKRRTNIDPAEKAEIIKRQEAYVKGYLKKAEKLRAQLMETEKEASTALAKEDPKMSDTSSDKKEDGPTDDGDFILEGSSVHDFFPNRASEE